MQHYITSVEFFSLESFWDFRVFGTGNYSGLIKTSLLAHHDLFRHHFGAHISEMWTTFLRPACFTLCSWSFTLLLSPPDSASPHVTTVPSRRTAANACIDEEICWTAWSLSRIEMLSPPLTMWPQVTTSPSSVSAANAWPVATTSRTFLRRSWTLEVNQMELCTQKCSSKSYLYVYYSRHMYTPTTQEASHNICSNDSK